MAESYGLYESLGVAAAAAQRLGGSLAGEALHHGFGPGGGQDRFDALAVDVPQGDAALAVQAAGDDGAVAEDAEVIPQAVAEVYLSVK